MVWQRLLNSCACARLAGLDISALSQCVGKDAMVCRGIARSQGSVSAGLGGLGLTVQSVFLILAVMRSMGIVTNHGSATVHLAGKDLTVTTQLSEYLLEYISCIYDLMHSI